MHSVSLVPGSSSFFNLGVYRRKSNYQLQHSGMPARPIILAYVCELWYIYHNNVLFARKTSMAKGPIYPSGIKEHCIETFFLLWKELRRKPIAAEIRMRMLSTLEPTDSIQLPQIRWIQRTIRDISSKLNKNDPYEIPWSIGLSQEYGIPPDSIRLLLDIQRWCSSIGYTFTLHEAMWAHTLKTIISTSLTVEEIHNWVKLYSAREKACKILEREIDTRDMDYFLTTLGYSDYPSGKHITPWTYFTLITVNKIKPFHPYTCSENGY